MLSRPLVKYILLAALRDRLITAVVLLILAGAGVSMFMGSAAIVEQFSFSTVFAAGGLRFVGVMGLVLFTTFHVRREFEHKEVEFLLSRPIRRFSFLFSHAVAFSILAMIIGLCVAAAVSVIGQPHFDGWLLWSGGIFIEYVIMAIAALFFAMVISSAAGCAMASLALYVMARMMGALLGTANAPNDFLIFRLMGKGMEVVSMIVPRFDLMGQSSWLIYGPPDDFSLLLMLGHGLVFVALLIAAAYYDLVRKVF